jgi:hypothetical protein
MQTAPRLLGPLLVTTVALAPLACEDNATRPREFENGPPTAEVIPDPEPEVTSPVTATATTTARTTEAPDWVKKGPTFTGEDGHQYGVAKVVGIRNPGLARSAADNRARAELMKAVGQAVEVEISDGKPSEKAKGYRAVTFGSEVVDHWIEPGTDAIYSLVRKTKEEPTENTKP